MPPRKQTLTQPSPGTPGEEGSTPTKDAKDRDGINIEDLSLPRTMVQRLAKGVLPPNTQIQKDAITAMSKGATVFVNYLSNAANMSTQSANKKTISPADVLFALREIEFEAFVPRLEAELARFNEVAAGKRNEYRRKVREGVMGKGKKGGEEDGERERKRVRREEEQGEGAVVEVEREGEGDGDGDETVEEGDEEDGERGMGEEVGDEVPEEGESDSERTEEEVDLVEERQGVEIEEVSSGEDSD